MIAVPLAVNPWARDAYSAIKALLVWVLTPAMLVGWAAAYLARRSPRWRATGPELPAWLLVLAALLSTGVTVDSRLTFFGASGRHEGLLTVLAYVALYFVAVHFFAGGGGMRLLTRCLGVGGVLASVHAAFQLGLGPRFFTEAYVYDWYAFPHLPRIFGPLGSPIALGAYLSVALPLSMAMAAASPGARRIIWSGALVLMAVALAFTSTRAAWGGTAAGVVLLFLLLRRTPGTRTVAISAVLAAVVSGGALLVVTGTLVPIVERAAAAVDPGTGSFAQRIYIWQRVIELVRARPLSGWGLETLGVVFPYDRASLVEAFGLRPAIIDRAHNDLLQVAVSMGLVGAVAYVAFWGSVLFIAWRLCRGISGPDRVLACGWLAALAAYLIQLQFSFSVVAVAPLVWLLAGASCGWEAAVRDGGDQGAGRYRMAMGSRIEMTSNPRSQ
ncbi:MAG: O-antigen ligase family protein [Armatimonadota bacterium]|nr:O-antigen ligase family protein [Armatimonadota bacterium]MDR7551181.1 O-antigen ligase family protein [Armatimonadota bacterium]